MKKFLIILIFVLYSVNIVQATNWKKIDGNLYYDTETIEYTDNEIRFWLKCYADEGYVKKLLLLNLTEKKITTEQVYMYKSDNTLIFSDKSSHTERVIPDANSEIIYQYFSSNHNMNNSNIAHGKNINTNNVDFGPYMKEVQRRIKLNWDPPKEKSDKQVVVLFKIAKDGRLLSCKVKQSSGVPDVDKAAIKAVEITAPFRPLPSKYNDNSVDVQFTFDYKVFGGSRRI